MKRIVLSFVPLLLASLSLLPVACFVPEDGTDGGDGSVVVQDASVDASSLEISNLGPHEIAEAESLTVQLVGDGGVPAYVWDRVSWDDSLEWVAVGKFTGVLQGRARTQTFGPRSVVIRLTDSQQRSIEREVLIDVKGCRPGQTTFCMFGESSGVCKEGIASCSNGTFDGGPCMEPDGGATPSDEFELCGAGCQGCDPRISSQCVEGVCVCGAESPCQNGEECCSTDGGRACSDLKHDVQNCGACGERCIPFAKGTVACEEGVCTFGCSPGWGRCSPEDPSVPGACETELFNNPQHCGDCATQCYPGQDAGSVVYSGNCTAGTCEKACVTGYADCGGNAECECPPPAVGDDTGTAYCGGGSCQVTCDDDGRLCDGACFKWDSRTHCRLCDVTCPANPPNTVTNSTVCAPGGCTGTCLPGWENCDGSWANGCEVYVDGNEASCGACTGGTVCTVGFTCSGGHCLQDCGDLGNTVCEQPSQCVGCDLECGPPPINCPMCCS